jgi:hypothetical protein
MGLKSAVTASKLDLRNWCSSPAALANPTPAYSAITNLRMVADEV